LKCPLQNICILCSVGIVCELCFRYPTTADISIGSDSRMNRISKYSFANCKVKRIILAKHVHVIDRFAVFESSIEHVSIEGSNDRFVFDQNSFLIDSDTSTAIRYFGTGNDLLISRDIKPLVNPVSPAVLTNGINSEL
jgi:hypothetical protein